MANNPTVDAGLVGLINAFRVAGPGTAIAVDGPAIRRRADVDVSVRLLAQEHFLCPSRQRGELLVDGSNLAGSSTDYRRSATVLEEVVEFNQRPLEALLHEYQVLACEVLGAGYE